MRNRIIGPYFFAEKMVTANTYLEMLQLYAVPQLLIYQQDGAPPHFTNIVHTFLDKQFPARLIGSVSPYIRGLQPTARVPPAALERVLCDPGRIFHKIQCVMNIEA